MSTTCSQNKSNFNRLFKLLACLFLIIITVVVYERVEGYDFIGLDDNLYVTNNKYVAEGFSVKNFKWAFTNIIAGQWIPMVWLSYMLDSQLCGLSPRWFHLTNLFFHLSNILLLFFLLNKFTNNIKKSLLAAAIFAIHPIHVESVAWVTERKDVLSMFFFLLSLHFYVEYVKNKKIWGYVSSILFFITGLMSKPMLVTMPFVLLIMDYWPLNRFAHNPILKTNKARSLKWIPLISEKIPYFFLSLIVGFVTILGNQKVGAIIPITELPIGDRIANTLVSYFNYLIKMFYPFELSVFYPYTGAPPWWEVLVAVFFLSAFSFSAFKMSARFPYLVTGWLWYIVTLIPVSGIVQSGIQSMADRFVYIPFIGIYLIIAWGGSDLIKTYPVRKSIIYATTATVILCLMLVSIRQVKFWENSITLFEHALEVTEENFLAHDVLGDALVKKGRLEEAIVHYQRVIQLNPEHVDAHNNLGAAFYVMRDLNKAAYYLNKALEINPTYVRAQTNLRNVKHKMKQSIDTPQDK